MLTRSTVTAAGASASRLARRSALWEAVAVKRPGTLPTAAGVVAAGVAIGPRPSGRLPATWTTGSTSQRRSACSKSLYSPGIVGYLNDYKLAVVRVQGEFVWHSHEETDDFFLGAEEAS